MRRYIFFAYIWICTQSEARFVFSVDFKSESDKNTDEIWLETKIIIYPNYLKKRITTGLVNVAR